MADVACRNCVTWTMELQPSLGFGLPQHYVCPRCGRIETVSENDEIEGKNLFTKPKIKGKTDRISVGSLPPHYIKILDPF